MNYAYALNDICGVFLLLMLLFSFHRRGEQLYMSAETLFKGMLLSNAFILALDFANWALTGCTLPAAREINLAFTMLFYAINPVVSYLYLLYCNKKLQLGERLFKIQAAAFSVLLVINAAAAVAGLFTPTMFIIDEANIYHRGPLFWLTMFIAYSMLLFSILQVIVVIIKNRHTNGRRIYSSLLLFPIPAIIGGVLQLTIDDISAVWVGTAFSMLILFLRIQNAQIGIDPLTGLANRNRMNSYIGYRLRHISRGRQLYCIMLDFDHFKCINDHYGHQIGNEALMLAADAMRAAGEREDFIVRYGGDEFVIIAERSCDEDILRLVDDIRDKAAQLCRQNGAEYSIEFSYGYSIAESDMDEDRLISLADNRMYENKAARRLVNE